jgi:hypothetical protein
MGLENSFHLGVLTTLGSGWTLDCAQPEVTESGWDTIRARYLAYKGQTENGAGLADDFPRGGVTVAGLNFRTVRAQPSPLGGGIWAMEVYGHGFVDGTKIKVTGGSRASTQTAENVITDVGTIPRFTGLEATPTVTIEYFTTGAPETNLVGLGGTPAVAPSVRSSAWTALPNPMQHFPNGWVMTGMDFDRLANTSWHLVAEQWEYIFRYSP